MANVNDNVYVTGLPSALNETILKKIFSEYGVVTQAKLLYNAGPSNGRCAALVRFQTESEAKWVVENMNGHVPTGLSMPVGIRFAEPTIPKALKKERAAAAKAQAQATRPTTAAAPPTRATGAGKGGGGGCGGGCGSNCGCGGYNAAWSYAHGYGGAYGGAAGAGRPSVQVAALPTDTVHVTGLPANMDAEWFRQIVSKYGKIIQSKLLPGAPPSQGKCAGLVRLSSVDEAKLVVSGLKGSVPHGLSEPVQVQFAESFDTKPKKISNGPVQNSVGSCSSSVSNDYGIMTIVRAFESSGAMPGGRGFQNNESTLYVAGLPPDAEDIHLYRLFSCFGAIAPKGVRAVVNQDGTCKGIGFVNFLSPSSAHKAINAFNGALLPDGTVMKVSVKMTNSKDNIGAEDKS